VISGSVPRNNHPEFEPSDLFQLWIEFTQRENALEELRSDSNTSESEDQIEDPNLRDQMFPMERTQSNGKYSKRQTAGFFYQILLFFWRAIIQHTRDIMGLLIDLVLICLAGIFLGVVFTEAVYVGKYSSQQIRNLYPI
jgi:hypothetical protein